MLFAEQSRDQSLLQAVEDYRSLVAKQGSYADYGFHAIITNLSETVLQDKPPVLARQGIMSMKLFLTYKHMHISDDQLLRALLKARELGMIALVHAENGDLVDFFTKQLEARGLTAPMYKAIAHPNAAEAEATNRAVTFAQVIETPLLIVHVSVPELAKVIRKAQGNLQPVFADMSTIPAYWEIGIGSGTFLRRQVHLFATFKKRAKRCRGHLEGAYQRYFDYFLFRSLPL